MKLVVVTIFCPLRINAYSRYNHQEHCTTMILIMVIIQIAIMKMISIIIFYCSIIGEVGETLEMGN